MKFLISLSFLFAGFSLFAQNQDEIIQQIRSDYAKINELLDPKYEVAFLKTFSVHSENWFLTKDQYLLDLTSCFYTESHGHSLQLFFKDNRDELIYAVEKIYDGDTEGLYQTTEYYFADGYLIFIYQVHDERMRMGDDILVPYEEVLMDYAEHRLYYHRGEPFKYLQKTITYDLTGAQREVEKFEASTPEQRIPSSAIDKATHLKSLLEELQDAWPFLEMRLNGQIKW